MPPDAPTEAAPRIGQRLRSIATLLNPEIMGIGPLAMLRRIDPSGIPPEPALHRLLARSVDDAAGTEEMLSWTMLIHAMALAAPDRIGFGLGLGRPLFTAGYKEGRMTRLLEARRDELALLVPRAVRFLLAHGERLDPDALAAFVLGVRGGGERAETSRTALARDYYRAERDARNSLAPTPSPAPPSSPAQGAPS